MKTFIVNFTQDEYDAIEKTCKHISDKCGKTISPDLFIRSTLARECGSRGFGNDMILELIRTSRIFYYK